MPAARGEAAEMGFGGLLVGEVERLRVIFARELDHFFARDLVAAEIGFGADFQVFEIDHAGAIATVTAWRETAACLGCKGDETFFCSDIFAPAPDGGRGGHAR